MAEAEKKMHLHINFHNGHKEYEYYKQRRKQNFVNNFYDFIWKQCIWPSHHIVIKIKRKKMKNN